MDEPQEKLADPGPKAVVIEHLQGDVVVAPHDPQPHIPPGKARRCPQCDRRAWRLSRHCWHCRYDFGMAVASTSSKLLFLASLFQLAAAMAFVLAVYASIAR